MRQLNVIPETIPGSFLAYVSGFKWTQPPPHPPSPNTPDWDYLWDNTN